MYLVITVTREIFHHGVTLTTLLSGSILIRNSDTTFQPHDHLWGKSYCLHWFWWWCGGSGSDSSSTGTVPDEVGMTSHTPPELVSGSNPSSYQGFQTH